MQLEAVIGLEVHVQLDTESKIFCACTNQFGGEPNSRVCPICLGYPGTLPVLNERVVDQALRLSLALGATVNMRSVFARKNYFYPDLPKGYQISQFDQPLAEWGRLPLRDGSELSITRLHLEEDAGKLLHEMPGGGALPGQSLVDFNRCGVPLVEIVTEPDLRSSSAAQDALQRLHQILVFTRTSDANMEEGSFRCDANVSIRRLGDDKLGTRAELKNINSFRFLERAINFEIERQIEVIEDGGKVVQETRLYDSERDETRSMRSKEEANDYRYFPDPDLLPLHVSNDQIESIKATLPELPDQKKHRFMDEFGLSLYDASVLIAEQRRADYYETVANDNDAKLAANWVINELLGILNKNETPLRDSPISAEQLGGLIALISDNTISGKIAKDVFAEMYKTGKDAAAIVEEKGLKQVTDTGAIEAIVDEVIAANPDNVAAYKGGKDKLFGFFVGQVMKASQGKAEPGQVRAALVKRIRG